MSLLQSLGEGLSTRKTGCGTAPKHMHRCEDEGGLSSLHGTLEPVLSTGIFISALVALTAYPQQFQGRGWQ